MRTSHRAMPAGGVQLLDCCGSSCNGRVGWPSAVRRMLPGCHQGYSDDWTVLHRLGLDCSLLINSTVYIRHVEVCYVAAEPLCLTAGCMHCDQGGRSGAVFDRQALPAAV
jgi:hypothetical protein